MTTARSRILRRLRAGSVPESQYQPANVWPADVFQDSESRIQAFISALTSSHAEVIRCGKDGIDQCLADVIKNKSLSQCTCAGNPGLVDHLLNAANLSGQKIEIQSLEDLHHIDDKHRLFHQIQMALTVADYAIANTGTLIIEPDALEPRSLSLVPPVHVVLIAASNIVDHLGHWLSSHPELQEAMPTNLVLVSGPSKTADIQQTLAYGAHGPKALIVLVIDDE